MYLFLIYFITLYGGMHVYAFVRLSSAFPAGRMISAFLKGYMALMTLAPLLVRMAEGAGFGLIAEWLAWPGYLWMGCMFIFCAALAATDTIRMSAWVSNRLFNTAVPPCLSVAVTCKIALLIALPASVYSIFEARNIRTQQVSITTDKLPPGTRTIRIVQISDVHIGLLFRESRLESVLQAVRASKPDILVSTGDMLDGRLSREDIFSHQDTLTAMLASVPAKDGKFAVTGNHEVYAGIDHAVDFTRKAGFIMLRNQSVSLPAGITISGVDDPGRQRDRQQNDKPPEADMLKSLSPGQFQLLLKHRPLIANAGDRRFDLQLSGHVHQGQLFPFNLLVRLKFPIPCGTTTARNGSTIHVSRGSGTWGPPMRLLAPPEVTVIDISSRSPGA